MPIGRASDGSRYFVPDNLRPEFLFFEDKFGRMPKNAAEKRQYERESILIALEVRGDKHGKDYHGELYRVVPRKNARKLVKDRRAVVIPESDKDYEKCMLIALGYDPETLKPIVQSQGTILDPEHMRVKNTNLVKKLQEAYFAKHKNQSATVRKS